MTNFTLNEYKSLSKRELAQVLKEEAEKMFGTASSEDTEKDSSGEPLSPKPFHIFRFGALAQYVKALVSKYREPHSSG